MGRVMNTAKAVTALRLAEAIEGLPEEFLVIHELRAVLKEIVKLTAKDQP